MRSESLANEKGKYLRETVFGFNDGLVSEIALVAGLGGAAVSGSIIILAGMAEMFAGMISMSLGTMLSIRSERDFYKKMVEREIGEMRDMPKIERQEVEVIYKRRGFSGNDLKMIVDKICSNKKTWLNVMLEEELGISPKMLEEPRSAAMFMGLAYGIGSIIPLASYFILPTSAALAPAIVLSMIGLFVMGSLKTKVTGRPWIRSGFETLFVGMVASAATYLIGKYLAGGF